MLETTYILPILVETSWLKKKLRPVRCLWPGSRGGSANYPSNGISSKKSRRKICCEIFASGNLFLWYNLYITLSKWNILVKEETENNLLLMARIGASLFVSPSNDIFLKKSRREICVEINASGSLFIWDSLVFTLSIWNILVKEETETNSWLMSRFLGRFTLQKSSLQKSLVRKFVYYPYQVEDLIKNKLRRVRGLWQGF